jgi:drug/metabolite transporter (DMT)-like permease
MNKYLVLALGVVAVAFAATFIRLAADAPPLTIAASRLAISAVVLAPITLVRSGRELRRLKGSEVLLAAASGGFLALHFGLWITSLSYTSVATSVVLVTVTPFFVAFASYLLFKERVTARILGGIAISIMGAAVIGWANWELGTKSVLGSLLSLGGAMAVVGYLLIGRKLRRTMGLLVYIFLAYGFAALFLIAAAVASGASFTGYPDMTYLWLVLLALVPQLLGHSSLNWSLAHVSATMVTVAVLGEPVGATLLAYFILHEPPRVAEIVGGLLILAGIVVAFTTRQPKLPQTLNSKS